jgi:hypothetical protein
VDFEALSIPSIIILLISSSVLLITRDWRISIGALAFQYIGVFALTALVWPPDLAVVKLVAGWMAASILGISRAGTFAIASEEETWPSGQIFRLLTAVLVMVAVVSLTPTISKTLPAIQIVQVWGSFYLIGVGLLTLGLTSRPLRTVSSLLTILSGFEVMYAAFESAILVVGLLALVNLGISMVGAYLVVAEEIPSEEAT